MLTIVLPRVSGWSRPPRVYSISDELSAILRALLHVRPR